MIQLGTLGGGLSKNCAQGPPGGPKSSPCGPKTTPELQKPVFELEASKFKSKVLMGKVLNAYGLPNNKWSVTLEIGKRLKLPR